MTDPDEAPEREERERLLPAWCPECNALVQPKHIDMGIGPYEYGSQRCWHHDWVVACPDCECTELCEPPEEDECRRCGEVEVCNEMGLCESCVKRIRSICPEARL